MTMKSILCAYSGESARQSGLRHALKLAHHHGAHITGVVSQGRPAIERRYAAQLPQALLAELERADAAQLAAVRQRFAALTAEAGLADRAEFQEVDGETGTSVSAFARCFDLTVTSPHSEAANEEHLSANPDLIALQSGRPVLVVPDGYESDGLADRALVAWDGKRAAARALADATPILAEKAHVTLLSVGAKPQGTDVLLRNMRRHGLSIDARSVQRAGSVSDTILAEAAKDDARLIVMGAFEHSKFSHDWFGGVTTDVIRDAAAPVFMAH